MTKRILWYSIFFIFLLIAGCAHKAGIEKESNPLEKNVVADEIKERQELQVKDNKTEKVKKMEAEMTLANEKAFENPLIWADVPDPDVIRVGKYYYMVSTTMHLSPGVPVMRSTDLVNWEMISYVYDTYAEDDKHQLLNGQSIYGKGSWAASIRYHGGQYYVCFACNEMNQTYIYQTDNLENGSWKRSVLKGIYHDPSLLFDNGHMYIVYGSGTIRIMELVEDAFGIKEHGNSRELIKTKTDGNIVNSEGSHFYKINGFYYVFVIEWPKSGTARRIEWCYRSNELLGKYEGKIVLDDHYGYSNSGVAQGGIIEAENKEWFAVLFQDHGAVGRIPMLVPVVWVDGWPMMGVEGKVPAKPMADAVQKELKIVTDDEFEYDKNKLKLQWQWNHNPVSKLWSVTERPGHLRLTTGEIVENLLQARNTLSQRTVGPTCSGIVKMDTTGMKPKDYAGIAAFQNNYGMLGVKVNENGQKALIVALNDGTGNPQELTSIPICQDVIYLKINFIFNQGSIKNLSIIDKAYFYYSLDGEEWIRIEKELSMKYTLDHFMGYRIALFYYATKEIGGYVDFDYFRYTPNR